MAEPKMPIRAGRKTGATQKSSRIRQATLARILEERIKRRVRGLIGAGRFQGFVTGGVVTGAMVVSGLRSLWLMRPTFR